jgi:transcriptional regulator with XRE-family HTH domain
MLIGLRIRTLREEARLSQGDIEKRSGIVRAYISRVEHGRTIPSVNTLERLARAMDVPLHRFFKDGEDPAAPARWPAKFMAVPGPTYHGDSHYESIRRLLPFMSRRNRTLLMFLASRLAQRKKRPKWLSGYDRLLRSSEEDVAF